MTSVDGLRLELNQMQQSLSEMREALREISTQLKDVIRLDGDLRRHSDALVRIGRQVDRHEERLLALETNGATITERVRSSASNRERLWWLVGVILAALLGAGLRAMSGG